MYLIRENGKVSGNEFITNFENTSSREKGNLLFFPGAGGANYFHAMGFPERTNIYWTLDTFIQPNKVFLDIGAHVGSYTLPCAPKAAHTYAFECTPKTFCYLAANVALHNLEDKVTLLPFALGNKEGTVDLIIRSDDGGGNGLFPLPEVKDTAFTRRQVMMKTLDSFSIDNIGFIKMDVEGVEIEVLEGAVETLKRNGYPKLMFECWQGEWFEQKKQSLFSYLTSLGYSRIIKINGTQDMYLAEH